MSRDECQNLAPNTAIYRPSTGDKGVVLRVINGCVWLTDRRFVLVSDHDLWETMPDMAVVESAKPNRTEPLTRGPSL